MTEPLAPRRILVAVDFGEASATAVTLGGMLAEAFGATLTVLHAETLEMPPYFTEAQIDALERERGEARAAGAAYLRRFAAQHTAVAVEPRVEDGPAPDAILRMAVGFDLVVLGTHGRRGPKRWWLGSVAETVARASTVPVLVTRALAPAALGGLRGGAALVLAEPGNGGAADRWAAALQQALRLVLTRSAAIEACAAGELRDVDFVVVSLPAAGAPGTAHEAVLEVLTSCLHPVLFVPAGVPASARRV